MRQVFIKLVAVFGLVLLAQSVGSAAPLGPGNLLGAAESNPLLHDARVFCYNGRTGRFLHWGHCGRRYVYRPRARYRWFCRTRGGRFLHWGRCYR